MDVPDPAMKSQEDMKEYAQEDPSLLESTSGMQRRSASCEEI